MVLYPRKHQDSLLITSNLSSTNPGVINRPDPTTLMVLYDKKFTLCPSAGGTLLTNIGGNHPCARHFKFKMKKCRYVLNYDNTNAVAVQPIIYFASDVSVTDTLKVFVTGYTSMSFKDM